MKRPLTEAEEKQLVARLPLLLPRKLTPKQAADLTELTLKKMFEQEEEDERIVDIRSGGKQ